MRACVLRTTPVTRILAIGEAPDSHGAHLPSNRGHSGLCLMVPIPREACGCGAQLHGRSSGCGNGFRETPQV